MSRIPEGNPLIPVGRSAFITEVNVNRREEANRFRAAAYLLQSFDIRPLNMSELNEFSTAYATDLERGVAGLSSSLAMINTLLTPVDVSQIPNSSAQVFELGGTKARGARTVIQDGQVSVQDYREVEIHSDDPNNPRRFNSVQQYFDAAIGSLGTQDRDANALAIVWAFPGNAIKTSQGIDVEAPAQLPKEFVIPGIADVPVGSALLDYLGLRNDTPIAVLNDTPAVALAGNAKIGAIVGSGFNIAITADGILYNTESGSFPAVPNNFAAAIVDGHSERIGEQLAEKQIGGIYLGKGMQATAEALRETGFLPIGIREQLTSETISNLLHLNRDQLKQSFSGYLDDASLAILSTAAARLRCRSAQLVGSMIGTAVKTFPDEFRGNETIRVPIEGGVFSGTPGYRALLNETASQTSGRDIRAFAIENSGIKGAGIAALSQV